MNRPGTVLVVALLAVLAMELVALSAFGFAHIARMGALRQQEHATMQAMADDALASAATALDAHEAAGLPVGAEWAIAHDAPVPTGATVAVKAQRLSEHLLLLSVALEPGRGASVETRALLRILPPDAVMQGFPAVVTTALPPGPVADPGTVDAGDCTAGGSLPAARVPWTSRAWADSLPFGRAAGVGWEDVHAMAAAATEYPPGASDSVRFHTVRGDTTIAGVVTGLLVVDGDVRLHAGSLVRGILVARGVLTMDTGARLEGVARALALRDLGATIAYDRCAVTDALATPPLRRAYRAGARWRLPAF